MLAWRVEALILILNIAVNGVDGGPGTERTIGKLIMRERSRLRIFLLASVIFCFTVSCFIDRSHVQ